LASMKRPEQDSPHLRGVRERAAKRGGVQPSLEAVRHIRRFSASPAARCRMRGTSIGSGSRVRPDCLASDESPATTRAGGFVAGPGKILDSAAPMRASRALNFSSRSTVDQAGRIHERGVCPELAGTRRSPTAVAAHAPGTAGRRRHGSTSPDRPALFGMSTPTGFASSPPRRAGCGISARRCPAYST